MLVRKKIIFLLTFFILFILIFLLFIFQHNLKLALFPDKSVSDDTKPVSCDQNDTNCIHEHANNLAKQLTGVNVAFAMHQCAGPHSCTSPDQKSIEAATEAIRAYVKNPDLQVIPINGITPAGIIYYCAKDDQCWKVDAKTNKVVSPVTQPQSISPTPLKPYIPKHL